MTKFVETSPVVIDLLAEGRLWRYLNKITRRHIECMRATNPKIGACRLDQALGARNDLTLGHWLGLAYQVIRKPVALRDVEDGKALEEWHARRCIALLRGAFHLAFWYEAISIAHGGTALPLADIAACAHGLLEGKPLLRSKTAFDDGTPQDEDVHAGIAPSGNGIARQSNACVGTAPWLHPWEAPLLQFGNDAACHFLIEIRPLAPVFSAGGMYDSLAHGSDPFRSNPRASPKAGWAATCDRKARRKAGCTVSLFRA